MNKIQELAWHTGIVMGLLSRPDVKKYLKDLDLTVLVQELMKLATEFYKDKIVLEGEPAGLTVQNILDTMKRTNATDFKVTFKDSKVFSGKNINLTVTIGD